MENQKKIIKVATLNIWHDQGPWLKRLAILKTQLRTLNPDILALQEVLQGPELDQAAVIAKDLGYHFIFGRASFRPSGSAFGNAILSRWPILTHAVHPLPVESGDEPRALLVCNIETPFGPIHFGSTHLSWRMEQSAIRADQIRKIISVFPSGVLMGDLNTPPDSVEMKLLKSWKDCFALTGQGSGETFCAKNTYAAAYQEPDRRIDYILIHPGDTLHPIQAGVCFDLPLKGVFPTDHFGVTAQIGVAP